MMNFNLGHFSVHRSARFFDRLTKTGFCTKVFGHNPFKRGCFINSAKQWGCKPYSTCTSQSIRISAARLSDILHDNYLHLAATYRFFAYHAWLLYHKNITNAIGFYNFFQIFSSFFEFFSKKRPLHTKRTFFFLLYTIYYTPRLSIAFSTR